jgi:ATP-dependent Lon protease
MTLTDGFHRIGGVSTKVKTVKRGFLTKILVPATNKDDVSENMHAARR